MARVARVIHEHLRREEGGSWKAVEGYSGVYIYICAASIWTYDGNNLEALGARRTYTEPPAATGGMCSQGVRRRYPLGRIRRRARRELSRNKSRDEREMWPNRTAHTDTVSRGRGKKEEGSATGSRILSLSPSRLGSARLLLLVRPRFTPRIFE